MVRLYAERIKKAGGYDHACYTPILHREDDTTHFHLIYASRSDKGLEVFKDAERSTSKVMEEKRANVQQAKRSIGGQQIMFGAGRNARPSPIIPRSVLSISTGQRLRFKNCSCPKSRFHTISRGAWP